MCEGEIGGDTLELKGKHGDVLGVALFNHGFTNSKNPIYVSIGLYPKCFTYDLIHLSVCWVVGHRVRLSTVIDLVKRCSLHRIPEPIRQADLRSRCYTREHQL